MAVRPHVQSCRRHGSRGALVLAAALCGVAAQAPAQSAYPVKPVRIVVGFQPGSSSDVAARIVAQKLATVLGQNVVVENRAGASSGIAARAVAGAPPDGHVLFLATVANVINTAANSPTDVDIARDLKPVALVGRVPNVLVVTPHLGLTSLGALIRHARAWPNDLSYGTAGNGTALHMAAALFSVQAEVKLTHVPYQGSAAAVTDLLAGRISMMFAPLSTALPYIRAGRLTALATTGAARSPIAPDLPTLMELGLRDFESTVWFGIAAPNGLPRQVEGILASGIREATESAEVREQFRAAGIEPSLMLLSDFNDLIRRETQKWARVIEAQGIRLF